MHIRIYILVDIKSVKFLQQHYEDYVTLGCAVL